MSQADAHSQRRTPDHRWQNRFRAAKYFIGWFRISSSNNSSHLKSRKPERSEFDENWDHLQRNVDYFIEVIASRRDDPEVARCCVELIDEARETLLRRCRCNQPDLFVCPGTVLYPQAFTDWLRIADEHEPLGGLGEFNWPAPPPVVFLLEHCKLLVNRAADLPNHEAGQNMDLKEIRAFALRTARLLLEGNRQFDARELAWEIERQRETMISLLTAGPAAAATSVNLGCTYWAAGDQLYKFSQPQLIPNDHEVAYDPSPDSCIEWYQKALSVAREFNDPYAEAMLVARLQRVGADLHRLDKSPLPTKTQTLDQLKNIVLVQKVPRAQELRPMAARLYWEIALAQAAFKRWRAAAVVGGVALKCLRGTQVPFPSMRSRLRRWRVLVFIPGGIVRGFLAFAQIMCVSFVLSQRAAPTSTADLFVGVSICTVMLIGTFKFDFWLTRAVESKPLKETEIEARERFAGLFLMTMIAASLAGAAVGSGAGVVYGFKFGSLAGFAVGVTLIVVTNCHKVFFLKKLVPPLVVGALAAILSSRLRTWFGTGQIAGLCSMALTIALFGFVYCGNGGCVGLFIALPPAIWVAAQVTSLWFSGLIAFLVWVVAFALQVMISMQSGEEVKYLLSRRR